jgi:hypothetical protein
MLTSPPTSSISRGRSPNQPNATASATTGTRYSAAVATVTVNRATAYPQVTKPTADGSRPRNTTDTVAPIGADAIRPIAAGASGSRKRVPAHIA